MRYLCRDDRLLELAEKKTVLHLGCVGFADLSTEDRVKMARQSLHYQLSEIANVTGIDYSREAIEYYRSNGVFDNVIFGDAEKLNEVPLETKFDLIIAGDIIEHLANPGLMLEGIMRFAHDDTRILITTPHSFGLPNYIRFIMGTFVEGAEHVMTFNTQNIFNLCDRAGYTVESIDTCYQSQAKQKALFGLGRRFFQWFPKFGGTLFIICRIK